MKPKLFQLLIMVLLLVPAQTFSQESALININKLAMWVRADGMSAHSPYSQSSTAIEWGSIYP